MDTGAALLRAVLESPFEDTVRWAYADWLDETGDPTDAARAAFIRTGLAAAREPDTGAQLVPPSVTDDAVGAGLMGPAVRVTWTVYAHYFAAGAFDYFPYKQTRYGLGRPCVMGIASGLVRRGFGSEIRTLAPTLRSTKEWVRALFSVHPIVRVRAIDVYPSVAAGADRNFWYWDLRLARLGHLKWWLSERHELTSEDALEALSRAYVSWGRSLVGLPDIPWENL